MAFVLQGEGDGGFFWIWIVFILLPLIGRVIGGVLAKLKSTTGSGSGEQEGPETEATSREERREVAKELERRGEEIWKELLGGGAPAREPEEIEHEEDEYEELGEPQPAPTAREAAPPEPSPLLRPAPRSRVPSRKVERIEPETPSDELPYRDTVPTQERKQSAARPRATIPALEGLDSPIVGFSSEYEPVQSLEPVRTPGEASAFGEGPSDELRVSAADWRRAVVWSEILGPPVALREASPPGPPASQP